jgi:hypothetical protein
MKTSFPANPGNGVDGVKTPPHVQMSVFVMPKRYADGGG